MRSYLIVANQTLASPALSAEVEGRIAAGPATFHVVVPLTPIVHRLTWDEDESRRAAQERLEALLDHVRSAGADASGEIGDPDPVAAVRDALRSVEVDEIILSTLPAGISRWLGQDVPSRLRGSATQPVVVVTAEREDAAAPHG
jgi:HEAT repeat protein